MKLQNVVVFLAPMLAAPVVGCEADEFADYVKVERTARVETGIFGNPGFEDQTKYGKVDEHSELGRFGYNGGGGLRVWTHAKNRSHHIRRGIRLELGKKYLFTAYVRIKRVRESCISRLYE